MQNQVTCAIVDDNVLIRERLQQLLLMFRSIQCCFSSGYENGIVDSLLQNQPKILFVGIELKNNDGFILVQELSSLGFSPKIIFTANTASYSMKALKNGAFDYLLHPIDIDELKLSINRYKKESKGDEIVLKHKLLNKLSEREQQLIDLLLQGKSSKEISELLNISKNTVNVHRRKILEKTGMSSTVQLIAKLKGINKYP